MCILNFIFKLMKENVMKNVIFAIFVMIFAGCTTIKYQPAPRPIERWVNMETATNEGRVEVFDFRYVVLSSKSVKIFGRVLGQQKINTYSEEKNSGRKKNRSSKWRVSSVSQIKLKSIIGSHALFLTSDGKFEYLLSIPEYDNTYFREPGNLSSNMILSRDLMTIDVSPIPGYINYPSVNLARLPIFIAKRKIARQVFFDLDKAVQNVERSLLSKVVLKFENMRSRLPENPLITIIGISGPTKDDLVKACLNLGYSKTQARSIVAELDYIEPNQEISDSGQMMLFTGIRNGMYGIEVRSAGTNFKRLNLVVEDNPITERTILLSPDRVIYSTTILQ